MKEIIKNFFVSGQKFNEFELDLQNRYQILNIGLVLSAIGMIYGIIGNIIRGVQGFVILESLLLVMIFILIILLRKFRWIFEYITIAMTTLFLFLFLYLLYVGNPVDLKHIWIITFPAVLLYFQSTKKVLPWLFLMIFLIILAPLQPFIEVQYSLYQVTYIAFVMLIASVMIYFHQNKMDQAQKLIQEQQDLLLNFNRELENQVVKKTAEFKELNESLEIRVQYKIEQLIQKDELLTVQSKQAVMGEMISMIAHQWRQPLSTVTLQISNLQLKKMLGNELSDGELEDAFNNISNTIIYLSETIDDFQTYFHPKKELDEIEVHELLQKAFNFTQARLKEIKIEISIKKKSDIYIKTYINELVQVVLNILNNAIDAHNDFKGKDPFIHLSVKDNGDTVSIYITDNAGGIKSEYLPKLFEPYFSTKAKNGTGLGLYMSQMIIQKQFNGEINVQTSQNNSTFAIKVQKNIH